LKYLKSREKDDHFFNLLRSEKPEERRERMMR